MLSRPTIADRLVRREHALPRLSWILGPADTLRVSLLALLVLLLPLMLGNRLPAAFALSVSLLTLIAAVLALLNAMQPAKQPLPLSWALWLLGFSLMCLLHWLPLPVLAALGPYPEELYQAGFVPQRWSPDGGATLLGWSVGVALFALVWTVRNLPREALRWLLAVLAVAVLFQAVYGLLEQISQSQTIFGIWERNNPRFAHGSFSNRNLYSAYLALGAVLVVGLPALGLFPGMSRWPAQLRLPLAGAAGLLVAMAIAGSASRGGFLALVVGVVVALLLWQRAPQLPMPRRLRVLLPWVVIAVLATGLIWFGLAPVAERLVATGYDGRLEVAVALLRETPLAWWLTGVGLGGFESTFRMMQPATQQLWYDYAHNDLLQWFFETGSFGLILLLAVGRALWRQREWDEFKLLAWPGMAAIGLVALLDFSWQIPATQVAIAILLGVLLRPRLGRPSDDLGSRRSRRRRAAKDAGQSRSVQMNAQVDAVSARGDGRVADCRHSRQERSSHLPAVHDKWS